MAGSIMRAVYIIKQAIATVLGESLKETWENLLAGRCARSTPIS